MCEYIYVLYSHFKHKALEMCAAEIKSPCAAWQRGWGAQMPLADLGRAPSPPAIPLHLNTNPTSTCMCGGKPHKALKQDSRLLSPSDSRPRCPKPRQVEQRWRPKEKSNP